MQKFWIKKRDFIDDFVNGFNGGNLRGTDQSYDVTEKSPVSERNPDPLADRNLIPQPHWDSIVECLWKGNANGNFRVLTSTVF